MDAEDNHMYEKWANKEEADEMIHSYLVEILNKMH